MMKFSLINLLTLVSFASWCLGLICVPAEYRSGFIGTTFFLVVILMFVIAMTSAVDNDGKLEYEKHPLLEASEPAFKLAIGFAVLAFAVLAVVAAIVLVYCLRYIMFH